MTEPSKELVEMARAELNRKQGYKIYGPAHPVVISHAEFGERVVRECGDVLDSIAEQWVNSLPLDGRESLNCRQYRKAILKHFGLPAKAVEGRESER